MEYDVHFENEHVHVSRAKLEPYEEVGLHRDALPQVVIALQGGRVNRVEADGSITEVHFPTGVPVFRKIDPIDELHKTVNSSSEPIELLIIQIKT